MKKTYRRETRHYFEDARPALPYEELKKRLCRAYGCTEQQKVNDLLDLPPLGAERPSVLMDNILSLWPDVTTKLTSKLLLGMCSTIDEKRFVFIM